MNEPTHLQVRSADKRQPLNVRCGECAHTWVAAYTPMGMTAFAKVLKSVRCPMCGANSKNIFLDS